jgi:hypothetical protein
VAVLFLWSRPCLWRVDRGGSFQGVPQMRDTLFEVPAACTDCGRKTDPFNGCRWCSESSDGTESARKASAGLIRKTNRTFPSPIKGQHGRDIRVWEVA